MEKSSQGKEKEVEETQPERRGEEEEEKPALGNITGAREGQQCPACGQARTPPPPKAS